MKLRTQLVIAAGLMLLLPWAGYRYILGLDQSLRAQQEDVLTIQARAAAAVIEARMPNDRVEAQTDGFDLYAARIADTASLSLDGYTDDWATARERALVFKLGDNKRQPVESGSTRAALLELMVARHAGRLYLHAAVQDDDVVYHNPQQETLASGDRLLLRLADAETRSGFRDYILSPVAPGTVRARYAGKRVDGIVQTLEYPAIRAHWVDTTKGYNVEVSLPLPDDLSGLGIAVGDVDNLDDAQTPLQWTGTFDPRERTSSGSLVYARDELNRGLLDVAPACGRLRYFDSEGWMRADVAADCPLRNQSGSLIQAALQRLFEQLILYPFALDLDIAQVNGKMIGATPDALQQGVRHARVNGVNTVVAVRQVREPGARNGLLVIEQEADSVRSLSTQALVQLFTLTVLAAMLISLTMWVYVAIVSWRIRRLRNHTTQALSESGEVHPPPVSNANDEIGELSRGLAAMLARVKAHYDYHRALSARLTHELRTPLSVVRTSIETYLPGDDSDDNLATLERAKSGADQLAVILRSLGESDRLEDMVADVELEVIDLNAFVTCAVEAYAAIFPDKAFESEVPDQPTHVRAQSELLRQLTDKLVDNAVEFSTPDSPVVMALVVEKNRATLSVINTGSQLPEEELDIFSPMISIRDASVAVDETTGDTRQDSAPHMGMGLYIAHQIALRHDAHLDARNLDYMMGVEFSLTMSVVRP